MRTIKNIPKTFSLLAAAVALVAVSVHAAPVLEGPVTANDARFVFGDGATAVSGGVEVDTSASDVQWHEYLVSVPAKVKLEAGKAYKLSYDYTITKVGGEKTRFYHIFRTGSNYAMDKGLFWTAAAGKGHKEFTATLGDFADYKLILGVESKGAIRIENLKIDDMSPPPGLPFSGPIAQDARFAFANGATVVNGGVEVDTTAAEGEWHEYFKTVPANVPFARGKTYNISYDYTVSKVGGGNTEFYHLMRTGVEYDQDVGMELWSATAGEKGHKEFSASLDGSNYNLILGVRFKGAIRISNLKMEEAK